MSISLILLLFLIRLGGNSKPKNTYPNAISSVQDAFSTKVSQQEQQCVNDIWCAKRYSFYDLCQSFMNMSNLWHVKRSSNIHDGITFKQVEQCVAHIKQQIGYEPKNHLHFLLFRYNGERVCCLADFQVHSRANELTAAAISIFTSFSSHFVHNNVVLFMTEQKSQMQAMQIHTIYQN